MEPSLNRLGNDIKTYRVESNLTQEDLAKLAGIERSQLSKIEKGQLTGVTYFTILKIYKSLGRNLISVVDDNNEPLDVHPFVKWAGGKTQSLEVISHYLPKHFNTYYEPFVGGGALLFKLQPKDFHINDNNKELMLAYQCFQDPVNFTLLLETLNIHEMNHSEEYYYKIREMDKQEDFNDLPIYIRAARMIYLNKSCFNGLYRVNSNGYFNVPSGKKSKVKCYDKENLLNIKQFFDQRTATITCTDFDLAVSDAKAGDFVYFDPPYDKLENKDSFTSYGKDDFDRNEQTRLYNTFKKLSEQGVYAMLSNHNTQFIRDLYKDYNINVIEAKRMINSDGKGRGKIEEVIITNY